MQLLARVGHKQANRVNVAFYTSMLVILARGLVCFTCRQMLCIQ
jgi:hypothetical protein